MRRKAVSGMMLTLLLQSMFTLAFNIQLVGELGTIYIRDDGSVDPPTAPISSVDNVTYTFTDNIINDFIIVERSNIIIDGDGYTLQGPSESGLGFDLTSVSNVTIQNTNIKDFDHGVWFSSSNNNNVSGNNITNNGNGIYLDSSSNNTISGNKIENNDSGVSLFDSSSYNIFFENNITNWEDGIYLDSSSHNNTFCGNNITNNSLGVLLGSSDNEFYYNNFVDNTEQVSILPSGGANFWDDGYPSGGNYWSNYIGVDVKNGPSQNEPGSDGIGDTPYIIDENNQDNYPWMNPNGAPPSQTYNLTITTEVGGTTDPAPGIYTYANGSSVSVIAIPDANYWLDHWELDGSNVGATNPINVTIDAHHALHSVFGTGIHVAVTNVTPSKTVVGQGYCMNITVTVENQGDITENFNVTACADRNITIIGDEITIGIQNVTLTSGNSTTVTFTWNTTGVAKGNYTISTIADTVPDETDTTDNTFTNGWIIVAMIGDITGGTPNVWDFIPDGKVNIRDIAVVARLFGVDYPDPRYEPNCDLTGPTIGVPDGKINIRDIALVASHFGEIDP